MANPYRLFAPPGARFPRAGSRRARLTHPGLLLALALLALGLSSCLEEDGTEPAATPKGSAQSAEAVPPSADPLRVAWGKAAQPGLPALQPASAAPSESRTLAGAPPPPSRTMEATPTAEEALAGLQGADDAERLPALLALGQVAAGEGADPQTQAALRQAAADPDPDVARVAQGLLDDLQRLQAWQAAVAHEETQRPVESPTARGHAEPPETPYLSGSAFTRPLERWSDRALYDPDERERSTAIAQLARHPTDETLGTLVEAAGDPFPQNRMQALTALGTLVVRGEQTPDLLDALRTASRDRDEVVAARARALLNLSARALEDHLGAMVELEALTDGGPGGR